MTVQNEKWLEAAKENFEEALESGDYHMCKAIIGDVQDVSLEEGRKLNDMLRATPLSHFTKPEEDY